MGPGLRHLPITVDDCSSSADWLRLWSRASKDESLEQLQCSCEH
jgi:hypothetical protein